MTNNRVSFLRNIFTNYENSSDTDMDTQPDNSYELQVKHAIIQYFEQCIGLYNVMLDQLCNIDGVVIASPTLKNDNLAITFRVSASTDVIDKIYTILGNASPQENCINVYGNMYSILSSNRGDTYADIEVIHIPA